jgi:glycosyltransferase involved in cell wall biosynthesis
VHICLITPSFPPQVDGGVAISTGRLVACLLDIGHRVTVLTTAPPGHPRGSVAGGMPQTGRLSVHYRLPDDPLRAMSAVNDLCSWAQAQHLQGPFDVILAYFIYPGGYLGTILGAHLGVPVVCSCRGNDVSKDLFVAPHIVATVLLRCTRLIFVSASLLCMADTLVPCRTKATIVANAVDGKLFVPATGLDREEQRSVTLGTSGLMRWKKGLDLFLMLIRMLCATHEVRVLVAGYGLDALIDRQIVDFLMRHDLHGRVEFTGPLPHQQIVGVLQRLDLYVNTSYQEGMPNGVLEAMACALPVVATDADGTPELVEHGVTGYLCRKGDLEAIAACCRRLIEQPVLRQRMGRAGRRRVLHDFHPAREAAAVEAVLRQACQSRDDMTAQSI